MIGNIYKPPKISQETDELIEVRTHFNRSHQNSS